MQLEPCCYAIDLSLIIAKIALTILSGVKDVAEIAFIYNVPKYDIREQTQTKRTKQGSLGAVTLSPEIFTVNFCHIDISELWLLKMPKGCLDATC